MSHTPNVQGNLCTTLLPEHLNNSVPAYSIRKEKHLSDKSLVYSSTVTLLYPVRHTEVDTVTISDFIASHLTNTSPISFSVI